MKSELYQGKIKQYNSEKGYGFIASAEGEVFFHISDFPRQKVNQNVMNVFNSMSLKMVTVTKRLILNVLKINLHTC